MIISQTLDYLEQVYTKIKLTEPFTYILTFKNFEALVLQLDLYDVMSQPLPT